MAEGQKTSREMAANSDKEKALQRWTIPVKLRRKQASEPCEQLGKQCARRRKQQGQGLEGRAAEAEGGRMRRDVTRSPGALQVSVRTPGLNDEMGPTRVISTRAIWSGSYFRSFSLAALIRIGSGEAGRTKTEERHQLGSPCNNIGET